MKPPFKSLQSLLLTLLIGMGPMAACQSLTSHPPADEMTVTEAANGSRVVLAVGGRLDLQLPTQPGTGYGWQLLEMPEALLPPGLGEGAERP